MAGSGCRRGVYHDRGPDDAANTARRLGAENISVFSEPAPSLASPAVATRYPTRVCTRLIERTLFADDSLANQKANRSRLQIARPPGTCAAAHQTARLTPPGPCIRRMARRTDAGRIRASRPTNIVWGDRVRILPPATWTHRAASAAREHHLFVGVGHRPQLESPDEFALSSKFHLLVGASPSQ